MTDREARDTLADALAAYLRGEITSFTIDGRIADVCRSPNRSVREAWHLVWTTYDDLDDCRVSASPESWQWMLSLLAWLRSDYGLRWRRGPLVMRPWHWPLSSNLLTALALAWLYLPLAGFIASWIALGIIWGATDKRRRAVPDLQTVVYQPFQSREDWEAHRHLLDADNLPAYDPNVHGPPTWLQRRERRLRVHKWVGEMVVLPISALLSLWPWRHTCYRRTDDTA